MANFIRMILMSLALLAGIPATAAAGELFHLSGKDAAGATVDLAVTDEMISSLGATEIRTKVVSLGDKALPVRGVEIRKLLEANRLVGDNLRVAALDGYVMDIPRTDIETYPVVLAFEIDGKRLSVRDKGPAWVIYPVTDHDELNDPIFEARSVWQVKTVTVEQK